jgi:chromosome segregation ATPase
LSDFPEYREISAIIAEKHSELETRKGAANRIRTELGSFDVADYNAKKTGRQVSLRTELQAQSQLEEELRRLESERGRIANEISAQLSRELFDRPVHALRQRHAELLREVAAMEGTIENYLSAIEAAGFRTGMLPRSVYLCGLGRRATAILLLQESCLAAASKKAP